MDSENLDKVLWEGKPHAFFYAVSLYGIDIAVGCVGIGIGIGFCLFFFDSSIQIADGYFYFFVGAGVVSICHGIAKLAYAVSGYLKATKQRIAVFKSRIMIFDEFPRTSEKSISLSDYSRIVSKRMKRKYCDLVFNACGDNSLGPTLFPAKDIGLFAIPSDMADYVVTLQESKYET